MPQKLILEWAKSELCLWDHFGIPCGAASRARLKRMSRHAHGPPPVRTPKWPNGLPTLTGVNLRRVRAANRLYSFMSKLIRHRHTDNKTWTVENPWASLLWETTYWDDVRPLKPYYCEIHNCMLGGRRLKRTCLASNHPAIQSLNIICDGQHTHEPWTVSNGVFDTSLEAEYTPLFAMTVARTVIEAIMEQFCCNAVTGHSKRLKLSHFNAIAVSRQPTRQLSLPVVPEFSHIIYPLPSTWLRRVESSPNA